MNEIILNEKYRPKQFEDVIGLPKEIIDLVGDNMPHLLFYSTSAGTGKTTTARIIAKKLGSDLLELNASDERQIEIIRNKIKRFASTMSSNNKFKIVFLDECDGMIRGSQEALRTIMEKYIKNCRFIITCNNVNKIIEYVQSRCVKVQFKDLPKDKILNRLKYICNEEKIEFDESALTQIINMYYPDVRSCINKVQELMNKKITVDRIIEDDTIYKEIYNTIKSGKFMASRKIIIENNIDTDILTTQIYHIMLKDKLDVEIKKEIIKVLAHIQANSGIVSDKELNFAAGMISLISLMSGS